MFFIYGYTRDNNGNPINMGGIVGHPDWSPQEMITQFWDGIADENWNLEQFKEVLRIAQFFRHFPIIGKKIDEFLTELEGRLHEWDELVRLSEPWSEYLQTAPKFDEFYGRLPEWLKNILEREHRLAHRNLSRWNQTAKVQVPYLRSSYSDEVQTSLNFSSLYNKTIKDGPLYLNHNMGGIDVLTLSRKAGLTGGMFQPPSENVVRQPGVLFAGFKKGGQNVFSNITLYRNGDGQYLKFIYDLVCFGRTRPVVKAMTERGVVQLVPTRPPKEPSGPGPFRWRDSLIYNLNQLGSVLTPCCTLWFEFETKDNISGNFVTMFSSEYNEVYQQKEEIRNNLLYQSWFNQGDPTRRDDDQNPFTKPDSFWPYALKVSLIDGWYLNPPTNLRASMGYQQRWYVLLEWQDNSGYELQYEIRRTQEGAPSKIILIDGNGSGTGPISWTDDDVWLGEVYTYTVRAKRDEWYSDYSNSVSASVAYSDSAPITAYNNANKVVVSGNNVHLTYFGMSSSGKEQVVYLHSSDGGNTWGALEEVYSEVGGLYPSITLGPSGEPYILCVTRWYWIGCYMAHKERWAIDYKVFWKENGSWVGRGVVTIEGDDNWNYGVAPGFEPPQASFVVKGDSGYIAYTVAPYPRVTTQAGVYYAAFKLMDNQLPQTWRFCDTMRPTILIDGSGRKVVVYSYCDSIRVWYQDSGQVGFTSQVIQNVGAVWHLTAALENNINLVLAWMNGEWGDTLKFCRLVRQSSGYAVGNIEVVDPVVENPCGTHPKFASGGSFGTPVILYETFSGTSYGIWYAFRLGPNSWLRGEVGN